MNSTHWSAQLRRYLLNGVKQQAKEKTLNLSEMFPKDLLWYTLTNILRLQRYVGATFPKGHVYSCIAMFRSLVRAPCFWLLCMFNVYLWVQCIFVCTLMCGAHETLSWLWAELTKTSAPCGALMPACLPACLTACLQLQADLENYIRANYVRANNIRANYIIANYIYISKLTNS